MELAPLPPKGGLASPEAVAEPGGHVNEQLSENVKSHAYLFSILLAAMVVRVLVGLVKPTLGLEAAVIVGLATVVFLSPSLYRFFYGEELIDTTRKRVSHSVAMLLSSGLFIFYVALPS